MTAAGDAGADDDAAADDGDDGADADADDGEDGCSLERRMIAGTTSSAVIMMSLLLVGRGCWLGQCSLHHPGDYQNSWPSLASPH